VAVLPTKTSAEFWEKHTKTALLIFMCSCFWVLMYFILKNDNNQTNDCKEQLIFFQTLYVSEKRSNDSFKNVLIMKDETMKQIPVTIDSLLRSKINKPVKQILKNTK
jgi:hypothetical protein